MKVNGGMRITVVMVLAVGVMLLSMPGLMAAQDLLVGVGSTIQRFTYNSATSAWDMVNGSFVTGTGVWDFTYGPDQNGDGYQDLFVSDNGAGVIRWYDGKTGGSVGTTYATQTGSEPCGLAVLGNTVYVGLDGPNSIAKPNGSGGFDTVVDYWDPRHMAVGPDLTGDGQDDLYIVGGEFVQVYGYDGAEWVREQIALNEPAGGYNFGITSGPDKTGDGISDLYLIDYSGKVEVLSGADGTYWGNLVSGGLTFPLSGKFGPDGNLYVNDYSAGQVAIYNLAGTRIGSISGVPTNLGLAFMPEEVVPEPSAMLGLASGLIGLAGFTLRRRQR